MQNETNLSPQEVREHLVSDLREVQSEILQYFQYHSKKENPKLITWLWKREREIMDDLKRLQETGKQEEACIDLIKNRANPYYGGVFGVSE